MAIRSFAVPVLLGLAGGVSGMLIASKGGTRAGLFLAVFADARMGMNSNKAEDVLAGSTPVFWAACLVWTAVFFAAAALWLRARGRGGIKCGGFSGFWLAFWRPMRYNGRQITQKGL